MCRQRNVTAHWHQDNPVQLRSDSFLNNFRYERQIGHKAIVWEFFMVNIRIFNLGIKTAVFSESGIKVVERERFAIYVQWPAIGLADSSLSRLQVGRGRCCNSWLLRNWKDLELDLLIQKWFRNKSVRMNTLKIQIVKLDWNWQLLWS